LPARKVKGIRKPRRQLPGFSVSLRLNYHGCAIGQNLCYALHYLSGVITDANHGIGAQLFGVLQHEVKRFFSGSLAKISQESDISANQRLQAGADSAED
jgi:hypothetical protein